ncbi:MAG TPA: hypothetical protein VNF50_01725 [Acidimicrobiales bacterium]|nr:hypothetical protein [Acidimicrobiales bacterium]
MALAQVAEVVRIKEVALCSASQAADRARFLVGQAWHHHRPSRAARSWPGTETTWR